MTILKSLLHSISKLAMAAALLILWFVMSIFISYALAWLDKERYQANDTPNTQFRVLVIDDKGEQQALLWSKLKAGDRLETTPDPQDSCGENCFSKKGENYIYQDEAALATLKSEYKIVNNKVIPVSFFKYHFGHVIIAMIISGIVLAICRYLLLRYWCRNNLAQIKDLNRKTQTSMIKSLLLIALIVFFMNIGRIFS